MKLLSTASAAVFLFSCASERPTFSDPPSSGDESDKVDGGRGDQSASNSESGSEANTATSSASTAGGQGATSSSEEDANTSTDSTKPTTSTCPEAPGGICECERDETRKCALSGAKGDCAEGTQTCTSEGMFGECDITPAKSDDCSVKGSDADCDGTPNSGCPCIDNETQECGPDTDEGACKYGTSTCQGSEYGECVGAIERAPRQCDSAQDNDCDGIPDDTLDDTCKCEPGQTQACNEHPGFDTVGPCRPGNQTCELSADGTHSDWSECVDDIGPAAKDSCVEGDNSDCVGTANTNCTCIVGRKETCGDRYDAKGICASVSLTCQSDGTWPADSSCEAAAETEDCSNNLDDNCDGTVNEPAACPCAEVPSPCAHGTCNAGTADAYTCDCTGTGYEGTLCDKPVALTVAGPTEATSCTVAGVSDNGTVVAANCEIGESDLRAYFWTGNAWTKAAIPSGYTSAKISALALSPDGTKAAGSLYSDSVSYAARWSGLSNAATVLHTPEWQYVTAMSANGNSMTAIDPGGNLSVWTGGGGSAPVTYIANGGVTGVLSGDGTKVFSGNPASGGFIVWASSTSSTTHTLTSNVGAVAASNDGTVGVGTYYGTPNSIYKYTNSGSGSANLQSTSDCTALSISSDGRYVLGRCAGGLYRWADATPSTVQSLLASTGSNVNIRTDVEGRMSYNAKYVALPSSSNGVVVVHLPSP